MCCSSFVNIWTDEHRGTISSSGYSSAVYDDDEAFRAPALLNNKRKAQKNVNDLSQGVFMAFHYDLKES